MTELETVAGMVTKITYSNQSNGFTVAEIDTGDELETIVGILPGIGVGEMLKLRGHYEMHATFGPEFKVEQYERSLPTTAAAILSYLSSGGIKGVGPVTAQRIVDKFGDSTLEIIEKYPERLAEIRGITKARASAIFDEYMKNFGIRELMLYLSQFKVNADESLRVYKMLGPAALDKIKLNPYFLCSDEVRFTFERADEIARSMGYDEKFEFRIMCGVEYVLRHNVLNGHTCLPADKVVSVSASLLGVENDIIENCCAKMIESSRMVQDDIDGRRFWFLPYEYRAERYIADIIKLSLMCAPYAVGNVDALMSDVEKELGIKFEGRQRDAIIAAAENAILVLTGGPGTGKTTTLNAIIRIFERSGMKILLAAPTGRAAKRMTEVCGYEAKTIHRLLEVEWDKGDRPVFTRNEHNTLDCHALIVDEMSMVDSKLFESLLRAVPHGCRLVLVGDSNQLPSVGAGNVLHDLIDSTVVPTVELTQIFRQAMTSAIVTNAHKILDGEEPDLKQRDSDFFFLRCSDSQKVAETVCNLAAVRLPKAYQFDMLNDIQILCPSRKWDAGTVSVNNIMQNLVNPQNGRKAEIKLAHCVLREGDKVMQIKNNYDIEWDKDDGTDGTGVFNGDVGTLDKIDLRAGVMYLRFEDRLATYSVDDADQLELAYAVTVHKSQGSEYPCVVMPMSDMPPQLKYRNLLYTAVTRAKKLLVMVGSQNVVNDMISNNKRMKRYTALKYYLEKSFGQTIKD